MRAFLLAVIVASISISRVSGHVVADAAPQATGASLSVSPSAATSGWIAHASNLPPSTSVTVVVLAPRNLQSVQAATTGPDGALDTDLQAPLGAWLPGIYRAVVGLPDRSAISALFSVGAPGPHLVAQPAVTSPYSAFNVMGTGLPADQDVSIVVHPGNLRAPRTFTAHTDALGNVSLYVWPEDLGEPFFEVGAYIADIPNLDLSAPFSVYEKPVGSRIAPIGDLLPGGDIPINASYYQPNRYLWGIYADDALNVRGEFLVGPTDDSGKVQATVPLPDTLPAGHYRIATPYDWGESEFDVLAPTPTNTPTATAIPTATSTPTSTPTATPKPTKTPGKKATKTPTRAVKKHCHRVHHKKVCTKKH